MTLHQGETIRIGRHSSNDLVLNHNTVSRFHAKLAWDPDEDRPYVQDNQSANGVSVDGEFIEERAYLSGDNQVDVGDFTIVLQLKGSTQRIRAEERDEEAILSNPTVVRLFSEKGRDIKGNYKGADHLHRALLKLEEEARTGTLYVKWGARKGGITFSQGLIVTCKRGEVLGLGALREILGTQRGYYEFSRDLEPSEQSLNLSIKEFLEREGAGETAEIGSD